MPHAIIFLAALLFLGFTLYSEKVGAKESATSFSIISAGLLLGGLVTLL